MNLISIFNAIPHISVLVITIIAVVLFGSFFRAESSNTGISDFLKFITLVGLLACIVLYTQKLSSFRPNSTVVNSMFYADMFSFFVTGLILVCAILNLPLVTKMFSSLHGDDSYRDSHAEFLALYLISILGSIVFATSANLLMSFLGLEIMSLALYCLCASALDKRESSEAGIKYFILGSVASAFVLYGMAMLYGATGSLSLVEISKMLNQVNGQVNWQVSTPIVIQNQFLLNLSLFLLIIGFVFKIGAVPLHFWLPDVYKGAPICVTSLMSSIVKIAGMTVTFRFLTTIFNFEAETWHSIISIVAGASLILGSLLAVNQNNVKRMLAFSGIAQVGYMLIALISASDIYGGGAALFFYLVIYSFVSIGLFSALNLLASEKDKGSDAYNLNNFKNLSTTRPMLAGVISLLLLTLAGLPPGIAGLTGKFFIFSAGIKSGHYLLVILASISVVISSYYYLKVIAEMYFKGESNFTGGQGNDFAISEAQTSFAMEPAFTLKGVVALCSLGVVYLGIKPNFLYEILGMVMFGFGR